MCMTIYPNPAVMAISVMDENTDNRSVFQVRLEQWASAAPCPLFSQTQVRWCIKQKLITDFSPVHQWLTSCYLLQLFNYQTQSSDSCLIIWPLIISTVFQCYLFCWHQCDFIVLFKTKTGYSLLLVLKNSLCSTAKGRENLVIKRLN